MPKKVGQGQPFEHRPIEGPRKVKKSDLENKAEQAASSSVPKVRAESSRIRSKVEKLGEPGQLPAGALKPSSGAPKPASMVQLDTYQGSFSEIKNAIQMLFPARADLIIRSGELTREEGAKLGLFLYNSKAATELAQEFGISQEEMATLLVAIKGEEGAFKIANGEELLRREEVFDELRALLSELQRETEPEEVHRASPSSKPPKKKASRSKAAAASTTVSRSPKELADQLIKDAEKKMRKDEGKTFTDTRVAREQLASALEFASKGALPAYLQKEIDRAGGVLAWADAKAVSYLEQYGE